MGNMMQIKALIQKYISSNLKEGVQIKKSYTIGRVKEVLKFQLIKDGYKLMQGYYLGKTTDRFGFKIQRDDTMKVLTDLKNFSVNE